MRRMSVVTLLALSACVTEQEYETVLNEREALRGRITKIEDELDQAKGRIKELETQLEDAKVAKPNRPPEAQVAAVFSELKLSKRDKIYANMVTSMGKIRCELYPNIAPTTVLNFVGLAEGTKEWTDPETGQKTMQKLYDGTKFHRVLKGFLIQAGDPLGTGRGGPGYVFPDEVWSDVRFDRPGLLAMANSGANTNGSQFFITDARPQHLNGRNTIFGQCDLETVRKIMDVETTGPEKAMPAEDVVLESVTIERVKLDD